MSLTLLALVTLCYVGIAVYEVSQRNLPMATVFAGYAFANIGLMFTVSS